GDRHVVWGRASIRRVRPQTRAFGSLVARVRDVGDHDVVPATDQLDLRESLLLDARANRGVPQSREKSRGAAVATPHRKQIRQSRLIRDVRIAIECGVAACGTCSGDTRERGVELVPVAWALCFEMRDL